MLAKLKLKLKFSVEFAFCKGKPAISIVCFYGCWEYGIANRNVCFN